MGTAWGGYQFCKLDFRWVRIPSSPPVEATTPVNRDTKPENLGMMSSLK